MSPRLRTLLMTSTALLALGLALPTLGAGPAGAQPTGANVVGGNATVSGGGTNNVIVNQSSDRAIINWNTFNISSGGSATFNQPGSSSITLNRVTGGLGPSVIDGTITANGRVFIINRDGMLFGRGAVINTAGFLATTNDIRNADFMAGRMNFNIPGRTNASIVNFGNITASSGGFAALVAPGVRNAGTISANLGTVALASGNSFTLDMYGDKLIQVAVGDQIADKVIDVATGKPLSSLVSNEGTLRANGGRVEITAAAARHIVDSVINNSGVIEANSVGTRGGRIVLGGATQTAGLPKQKIRISGKISATGKEKGSKGGTIQITGEDIQFAAAMLDVSGHSGGGKILVGGDYGGGRPLPGGVNNQSAALESYAIPTASTVTVDSATTFNASATANGNGGKVILWSDVLTTFAGTIFARGGEQGGNGGFVEVSGKQQLAFTGLVDTRAPNGQSGLLLLDPEEFNIDTAAAATIVANLDTTDVLITTGASGTGSGNITVNAPIVWDTSNGLTLSAYKDVIVNANITNTYGGAAVVLRADNTGTGVGTVSFAAEGAYVSTSGRVSIFYNPVTYTDEATRSDASGNPYSSFVGGYSNLTAYMLVNSVANLDAMRTNLTGKYALGRDIDAAATATWNGGDGFTPIGTESQQFSGVLAGQGQIISNLTIDSSRRHTGLFGYIGSQGSVDNLGLVNVNIVASGQPTHGWVGALAGQNAGTISRVYATGSVTADDRAYDVGGLVGRNDGTIRQSYADVATSGGENSAIGGLAGRNYGTIEYAYSLGSVTTGASSFVGGLVGWNTGSGTIRQTYATGAVSAGAGSNTGGLVGVNDQNATVSSSYWDIGTTGQDGSAGDGTGLATADARSRESYSQLTFGGEGAWFMVDGMTRPMLRSEWSQTIRNTHQLQLMAMDLGANYVLAGNVDFTGQYGEAGIWGSRGFAPVGSISQRGNDPFVGSLDGQGFTINALMLAPNDVTTRSIGLFGAIGAAGSVSNLNITNASVSANTDLKQPIEGPPVSQWLGILAGQSGGTITNVTVENSTVSGLSVVGVIAGGLVGQHGILGNEVNYAGTIINSQAKNVTITVADGDACPGSCLFNAAGGLVGVNVGGSSITGSSATGTVSGGATTWAGGLVGQNGFLGFNNDGTITGSWANVIVTVSGNQSAAGGLVGSNMAGSTITDSQAFGAVASTFAGPGEGSAGGLVGENSGIITSTTAPVLASTCAAGAGFSCATGNVNVAAGNAGGLVGNNNGLIEYAFAKGAVSASGNGASAGGLVGNNNSSVWTSFAIGDVTVSGNHSVAGGLVGNNAEGSTITDSQAFGAVAATFNGTDFGEGATAGGLVGRNLGLITSTTVPVLASTCVAGAGISCATGNVSVGVNGSGGGLVGDNVFGTIEKSFATGNVSGANGINDALMTTLGGLVGNNVGTITDSFARTGTVGGASSRFTAAGGLVGNNFGSIDHSSAAGAVVVGNDSTAGGFAGLNSGDITLSYATGSVTGGDRTILGGFVGINAGGINQAYASGAVTGGASSLVGGFVGYNWHQNLSLALSEAGPGSFGSGLITQSYALGPVTGGNAAIAAAFAAFNLGTLQEVYGVGRVQGGTGSTLGGLVATNTAPASFPDLNAPVPPGASNGTATDSYWDMQTTAQTTSAGGTGMNTAVLAGGLPPGFDPTIWSHHSYPFLVNFVPNNQDTTPGPPVIPPVGETTTTENLQPPNQQINQVTPGSGTTTNDPVPNTTQFVQQQTTQTQQRQGGGGAQDVTGSVPPGPQPIRLDVGDADRFFYLPPPEETRLVVNEVVLQMPCNVPQTVVDGILKQNNLTMLGSQCLREGGNAAFRMRYASSQQIAAVIKALASHQVIAAAQANYTYQLTETSVQSATSQQGDPGQYITEKLRLFAAHRIVTGNGVQIGVVDSEVDGTHPDLTGAIVNHYDATGVEDSPHAHGTGMAGAIVSHQKLLGVAPGARILAVRAFSTRNTNPESTTYHILRAIDWAVANNVRIINMSFAGPRDPSLERALKTAHEKGIVLIAAAGNAGPRAPAMYPAADPNVIAVTATDMDDKLFSGANRGNHVAISAPGVDILVPAPAGEYQVTTGTSVATAHVSGVVALMLERNPKLTPADVRRILIASARRLGPANMFGAGLVDPIKAIEMATPRSASVPAAPQPPAAAAAPAVPKRSSALPRPTTTVAARP